MKQNTLSSKNLATPIILVSGLSGAGKSSALNILEDIGYEVVDNLPLSLVERIIPQTPGKFSPLALGIDSRTRDFSSIKVTNLINQLRMLHTNETSFLFLDSDDHILIRRFEETRRRHPKAVDRSIIDGINFERKLLRSLRDYADQIIDTSDLDLGHLKRIISGYFGLKNGTQLSIFIVSFSFKIGIPRNADIVLDVRFLANPFYNEALKKMNGCDKPVREFIEQDTVYEKFTSHLKFLFETLFPRYRDEGKSYLTIAFGCSGGRHRSVALAEAIGCWANEGGWPVAVEHRDLDKVI